MIIFAFSLFLCGAIVIFIYLLLTSMQIGGPGRKRSRKKKRSGDEQLELETQEYEKSFIFITKEELKSKRLTMMVIFGCFGAVGFLIGIVPGILCISALGVLGNFVPQMTLQNQISKRQKAFQSQILDTLETVSNGLKAGLSFIQSLESASVQLPDPMKQELQYTLRQNSLGVNLDEALTNMSERMKNQNFNLIVSAITVTRQLGGNLPEIFKIISETIRDRDTMEGKIDALTSQGKMQALLMGSMPFILMLGVFLLDKKTIMPLFTTPIGWGLLVLMLVLNGLGFFFIKKIVSIDI